MIVGRRLVLDLHLLRSQLCQLVIGNVRVVCPQLVLDLNDLWHMTRRQLLRRVLLRVGWRRHAWRRRRGLLSINILRGSMCLNPVADSLCMLLLLLLLSIELLQLLWRKLRSRTCHVAALHLKLLASILSISLRMGHLLLECRSLLGHGCVSLLHLCRRDVLTVHLRDSHACIWCLHRHRSPSLLMLRQL